MINSLRAELRKIYSVRSTYATLAFCFLIMCIYAFWVEGYKAGDGSRSAADIHKLAFLLRDAVGNLAFFGGIVGVLCFSNEYRYNTITYTLTASNSRVRILVSKIIAITLYSILFTIFVAVFASLLMYIGITVKGLSLGHQVLPVDILYKIFFTSWGFCMAGLLIASLVRNQVGAIATFFAMPSFIEPLAGLALKDKSVYLPFIALHQVSVTPPELKHALTPAKAAMVFSVTIVIGWAIGWYLFLKRDAN
jgi:ABC-type transport system involved in multi-copper enzyme maturation permease subunit